MRMLNSVVCHVLKNKFPHSQSKDAPKLFQFTWNQSFEKKKKKKINMVVADESMFTVYIHILFG